MLRLLLCALLLATGGCLPDKEGPQDASGEQLTKDLMPDLGTVLPLDWVELPAGSFLMGSPHAEICRGDDEVQHQVTLGHAFTISTTEVTRGQFYRVMGYLPAEEQPCEGCPISFVSWHQAAAFCNALSTKEGRPRCYACSGSGSRARCDLLSTLQQPSELYGCTGYRLPTEAEWEYAYRAGTQTALYSGAIKSCFDTRDADAHPDAKTDPNLEQNAATIAWYRSTSDAKRGAGLLEANAFGLYDMAGNVREWVHDRYGSFGNGDTQDPTGPEQGAYRVLRGGDGRSDVLDLRAARRFLHSPSYRDGLTGFRVVRRGGS